MKGKSFTSFFIYRPVFTIVISLLLMLVGGVSYFSLPVRWVPSIQPPIVAVYTGFSGASAHLMESRITTPIETALAGVSGIETISSSSNQGTSTIILKFKSGHNLNAAVEDVRSALQSIKSSLPVDADVPIVQKADPDSAPNMVLAFSSTKLTPRALSDYVKQFLLPQLQAVDGVAAVDVYGRQDSVMNIWLNPNKMAATSVTVNDVVSALDAQNTAVASGTIRGSTRYYPVIAKQTLDSAHSFNTLVISNDANNKVRLGDVGNASMDSGFDDEAFRVDGIPAIALAIQPQSSANPLHVAKSIQKIFHKIQNNLPAGMQGSIVYNSATWISSSIYHVFGSLLEAVLLVFVVVYCFLGQFRAALIPLVTIPVCLITTFAIMHYIGVSINTVTLMAFVLAIGLVVDDAIVILENIRRHIEEGKQPFYAAIRGSSEMIFPIIAMTLTLVAVYAPAAFVNGVTGTVFREFAVTLAGAVLVSGWLALSLSPMMCAYQLNTTKKAKISIRLSQIVEKLKDFFTELQRFFLQKPYILLVILLIVAGLGLYFFKNIPAELMPTEDMDQMNAFISAPRNASFAWTDSRVKELNKLCNKLPGVASCISEVGFQGPTKAMQIIKLKPKSARKLGVEELQQLYQQGADKIIGVKVFVMPASSPLSWYSEGRGSSISMKIISPVSYQDLYHLTQNLVTEARKFPGFVRVNSGLNWDGEQFELNIDRDKAADMHVAISDVTNMLSTLLSGRTHGFFESNGTLYDINLQMQRSFLSDPNIFSSLFVRNYSGKMIPISGFTKINEVSTPEKFSHFDRLRADSLHVSLKPNYSLAAGVHEMQKLAMDVLPDNARYEFVGDAKTYLDSGSKMSLIFGLALVFIYLALAAQFESFIDPMIILLTVPFSLASAIMVLKICGGTLNLYSEIALVTLVGLIAKHGILVTEFANREFQLGYSILEAATRSVRMRLRPVLMTTFAMVLGALPLAIASGAGSETRHQVGLVIVGGLIPGTFFSLVLVPFLWVKLARFRIKRIILSEDLDDGKISV